MYDEIQISLGNTARTAFRFYDDLSDAEREQVLPALVELMPQREAEIAQNTLSHLQQHREAGPALRALLSPSDAHTSAGEPARERAAGARNIAVRAKSDTRRFTLSVKDGGAGDCICSLGSKFQTDTFRQGGTSPPRSSTRFNSS